jgi:pimeloyl-ACP methyl ester carboxylesterase
VAPRPIFIHGAGGGPETWQLQEPRFEGCYVVSLPGHPAGTALSSVGGYAEWTAGAIGEIPGPRVLVGHSMGGAVALQVAMDQPDLVDGVVMVASGARLFVPDAAFEGARTDFTAECARLLRKGWPSADDATVAAEAEFMIANGQETLLRDYRACSDFDVRARLGDVAVPVLVVAGTDDALTPPRLAEELAAGLRQSLAVIVPDTGHWPMKERPASIDLLIAGFLARLETSGV